MNVLIVLPVYFNSSFAVTFSCIPLTVFSFNLLNILVLKHIILFYMLHNKKYLKNEDGKRIKDKKQSNIFTY